MNTKRDKKERNVFKGRCLNLLAGCHQDKDCIYCVDYEPIESRSIATEKG